MARKASTVYQIEYSWKRSPEVWGSLVKAFLSGAVVTAIAMAILFGGQVEKAGKNVPCKPTTSVAPKNDSNP